MDILGALSNVLGGSGSGNSGSANGSISPTVGKQLVASFGNISLGANLNPQNMVEIPNYNGYDISSITISLSFNQTNTATAPTGPQAIENAISFFKVQTKGGKDILPFYGGYLDISNTCRNLNPAGLVNNSPLINTTASFSGAVGPWEITIPLAIAKKWQPLKLFVTFNTLSALATTLNGMTATVSLNVYATYHPLKNVTDMCIVTQTIPVASTGDSIALQSNFPQDRICYMQAYVYGDVQASSATDSPIGSTGSGITFTPTGAPYYQSAPLSNFITEENTRFPNTTGNSTGHETGMINLFTDPFTITAATQFNVGFTSLPSSSGSSGQSGQMRAIWLMDLK